MPATLDVQHPPGLARVTVHSPSNSRRAAIVSIFVVLYAVAGQWCYNTAGEPLAAAIKEAEAKEAARNATNATRNATGNLLTEDLLNELAEIEAEPHHSLGDTNITNGTVLSPKPMPSWYLPNAWAGALLFAIITLNSLFFLMGHWYVGFKAAIRFAPASKVRAGVSVHVHPHAHGGSGAMCAIQRSSYPPHRLGFEFQRQRYEYIPQEDAETERSKQDGIVGLGACNGFVRHVECPVDLPISTYHESQGLDDEEVKVGCDRFGQNTLSIQTPKFLDLYKQQMMSPLVVFQFFTSILWMLDEYWQFVMFNMGMIFMLESTTVFQRIKTFGTLNSMSSKPYKIQAFRNKKWQELSTLDLLPGDLISVKAAPPKSIVAAGPVANTAVTKPDAKKKPKQEALQENTGVVPCDCLLLHGDAVVNEASLTGESVPQMKDALKVAQGQEGTALDIEGAHRVHMMFSGTQIVAGHGGMQSGGASANGTHFQCCPDGGCVCYVVRTGFNSSLGSMIQTVEYSQQKLTDNSKETGYALLVLLFFALIASGYVLKRGLEKGDRTTHELLIKCVIIITSTVPKQLPMQMAMAVNTALMGLMKCGVFCTEPYRVPIAGKVNMCVFDKTGTLTTDELVPIGMINPTGPRTGTGSKAQKKKDVDTKSALKPGDKVTVDSVSAKPELNGEAVEVCSIKADGRVEVKRVSGDRVSLKRQNLLLPLPSVPSDQGNMPPHGLFPIPEACPEALMVIAGCHSLVEVEGAGVMGDPIELSAMKGIEWRYESKSNTSLAGNWETTEKAMTNLKAQMQTFKAEETQKKEEAEKKLASARERISEAKAKAQRSPLKSVKIKHRHHFSSKLQRMSTVAFVDQDASPKGGVCLVKGSPEAIRGLMLPEEVPEWYDRTYRELAEHGLRVLSLAYKWCDGKQLDLKAGEAPLRNWVESDLRFAGFLAFGCKTRADSALVLQSIKDADIGIGMLTGDAPLTALHVARDVCICSPEASRPCLLLELEQHSEAVQWVRAVGEDRQPQPFCSPGV